MRGWLDSSWIHGAGYLAVAFAAVVAGAREHRRRRMELDIWPTFWYLAAGLFLVMAIGRAGNLAGLAANLGREEAVSEGWYDMRRRYQAMVVGGVMAVWFTTLVAAFQRGRRGRYRVMALMASTIVCFVAVRVISLHQIDGLLYRRSVAGVPFGAVLELALLGIALGVTLWSALLVATLDPLGAPVRGPLVDAAKPGLDGS